MDQKTGTASFLSFSLGESQANNVKIDGKQIAVSNYYEDAGSVVVKLKYPSKPEIMPITLTFTTKPFALRQWSIVDPQSVEVIVSLYDVETDTSLAKDLFKFKKAKCRI